MTKRAPSPLTPGTGVRPHGAFDEYVDLVARRAVPHPPEGWSHECAVRTALQTLGPALVLDLNDRRIKNELAGETSCARYKDFALGLTTAAGMKRFESRYPEQVARCERALHESATLVQFVAKCFRRDWDDLRDWISQDSITSIDPLGDFHDGVAVARITTATGGRLYWKPGDQRNDQFVANVLAWIDDRTETSSGSPRVPEVKKKQDYSWSRHVDFSPVAGAAIDEAYRGAGRLAACAYALGITDLHHENVLFSQGRIHVIDSETIFSTRLHSPKYFSEAHKALHEMMSQSVLGSGLFPAGTGFRELGGDVSGLGATHFRASRPFIVDFAKDTMRYERGVVESQVHGNAPALGDAATMASERLTNILQGFREALMAVTDDATDFADVVRDGAHGCKIRVLARNTAAYALLMRMHNHPDPGSPEKAAAALRRNSLGLDDRLIRSEIEQMQRGAIPAFYARPFGGEVLDPANRVVGHLPEPPVQAVLRRVLALDADEIERQASQVAFSLTATRAFSKNNPPILFFQRHCVPRSKLRSTIATALHDLTDRVLGRAQRAPDGSLAWAGVSVDDHDQLRLTVLEDDIYGGTPGLLKGLLSAGRALGRDDILSRVEQQTDWLREAGMNAAKRPNGCSWYLGALGVATLLRDMGAGSREICEEIDTTAVRDHSMDLMNGSPGGVLGFLGANRLDKADELLDSILMAENETELGSLWGDPKQQNVSFAHGGRGVSAALLLGAKATGRPDLVDAWRRAERFNASLVTTGSPWPDYRNTDRQPSPNWCHGVTGVVVQRTLESNAWGSLTPDEVDRSRDELARAQRWLSNEYDSPRSLSLCHGAFGNLAALWNARNVGGLELALDPRAKISALAEWGRASNWRHGTAEGYQNLGFMTGISGILEVLSAILEERDVDGLMGGWRSCVS